MKKIKVQIEVELRVDSMDSEDVMDALTLHFEDAVQERSVEYTIIDDETEEEGEE